uniref:Ig-like domain-containing protein n=1 Tax=Mesocestoides corti TaxID=53468 RepID=A0A5K3EKF1_MESCO
MQFALPLVVPLLLAHYVNSNTLSRSIYLPPSPISFPTSPPESSFEDSFVNEYNVYEARETSTPAKRKRKGLSQREDILEKIFLNYKTHERPTELLDTSTVVRVNMKIQSIFSIDVRTMDYYVDALLRQAWVDPRLAWDKMPEHRNFTQPIVSPKMKNQLWLPDLFFRNGKEGYLHKMTLPNYLLRVYPNGQVLYSQKITMRFACQMDLQTFPMDVQECDINIGSYGYTLSELKFMWSETSPIELNDEMQLSEFNAPKHFATFDCTSQASTSTGNYTCLLAKFSIARQLGSYLVTTYIPNILIIMVSWLSFWVSVDAAPARVPLGLMSLLGILTQASSVGSNLPRVSYIKALDLWLIFSIIFVISVLVEYALAISYLRKTRKCQWKDDLRAIVREELARWCSACQQKELESMRAAGAVVPKYQADYYTQMEAMITFRDAIEQYHKKRDARSGKDSVIDGYSRFLFPLCYLAYNICYWLYYLVLVKH